MSLLILNAVPNCNHFGSNALAVFRSACLDSIAKDPTHAIFYRLLADHADHLIDAYHQVPLDASEADRDFENLTHIVAIAEDASGKAPEIQLAAVNQIALARYF